MERKREVVADYLACDDMEEKEKFKRGRNIAHKTNYAKVG